MNTLQILYQSDNNYAIFMGVSICSLLENNKNIENIIVYVIDDGISEDNISKLQCMVKKYGRKINFITGQKVFENKEITDAFSYTGMRKNTHSYLKMFFDTLLPDVTGDLLYIDCDTAITGSLSELTYLDMQDKTIGMVMDSLVINSKKTVGLQSNDRYYNSGVILINVERWKKYHCAERILSHIKNVRTYGTVDQDVLNVVLKEEIFTLPIKYNLQPIHLEYSYNLYSKVYKHKETYYSKGEVEEAVKNPLIIHYLRYIGESPWNADNVHPGTQFFDKYLALSPWKDYEKKTANRGKVFKIEKWMYKCLPGIVFLKIFYVVHERMITKSNKVK